MGITLQAITSENWREKRPCKKGYWFARFVASQENTSPQITLERQKVKYAMDVFRPDVIAAF
jgi:hypothetical protein